MSAESRGKNNSPAKPASEYRPEIDKPLFKSSFKSWIRIVAFIIVAVFLPEQISWAIEYDWRALWPRAAQPLGPQLAANPYQTFSPNYTQNASQIDIPLTIKKILEDIANKPINAVKLSNGTTIELKEPLKMSRERIEQIYNWLKGKPCGSKTLYDYLKIKGVTLEEQDIAVLALTIDILNGVVKPEGNTEVIKNSLYALSQASEFFGHKLYPVIIDFNSRTTQLSNSITPFIAHFKGDHYILVSRISDEKVYFIDEHKEEFLPKEKFLEEFSGYALIDAKNPSSDTYQLLTDTQAKEVLGGRKDYTKYTRPADLSVYFKKPPLKDTLLSLGITVADRKS